MIAELGENLAQYYYDLNDGQPLNDSEIQEVIEDNKLAEPKQPEYPELAKFDLTPEEWDNLNQAEKDKIIECYN